MAKQYYQTSTKLIMRRRQNMRNVDAVHTICVKPKKYFESQYHDDNVRDSVGFAYISKDYTILIELYQHIMCTD